MNISKNIRKMQISDLPEVLKIETELFSDVWTEQMFVEEINTQVSYVLELDNEIAGYICGWKLYDEFNITNVAVSKKYQQKGYGKLLVDFIITEIAKENFHILFLEVRESNLAAIKLYERVGFNEVGRRKKYYKNPTEDAILMNLNNKINIEKEDNER
ncbi:MAG: ribosomal protein S18-alanine N-acetyltransferase [Candidatus Cloacimonetes bacterium]|nr:ribosomal protein S18-alanine N-acetyltransferase [Candidatus Cloacimonadota bacterium]